MFIAVQFMIAKSWNQPTCSSTYEWTKKTWYLYTMEYHTAVKKAKLESFVGKWMHC